MEAKIGALEARICWCKEGKGIVTPVVPILQEENQDQDLGSNVSYHTPPIVESGVLIPIKAKEEDGL